MKKTGRRTLSLLLAVLFLLPGFCLVVRADPDPAPTEQATDPATEQEAEQAAEPAAEPAPEAEQKGGGPAQKVKCPHAICYDLYFDKMLFEKGADESIAPAAFTKLMTALLGYEYLKENGNVDVTITEDMLSNAAGAGIRLKVGEVIPLNSLLIGLSVYNANDAAQAIAFTVSGNISAFVERMNARAEELGMTATYYTNPTGVDSAMMHTTLRDTLTLCQAVYRVNDFMTVTSEEHMTLPATNLSQERYFTNKNALIPYKAETDYMVRGARGFIAGYTGMAGYVCATCRNTDEAITLVILAGGVDASEARDGTGITSYHDAAYLLDWEREAYTVLEVIPKETTICEKKVRLSEADHTVLVTGSNLKVLLPSSVTEQDIRREILVESEVLTAPIHKGQKYGEAVLYWGEEELGRVDLVAQTNAPLSRFLMIWDAVKRFFSTGPARVFLIIVIFSAVLYLVILIATVYIQYLRNTRERRQVIREMEERENRRLRELRKTERARTQRTLRRARNAVREGYRVFSGQSDALGSGRAVARVPEKYRRAEIAPQRTQRSGNTRPVRRPAANGGRVPPQRPQRQPERYRTTPSSRTGTNAVRRPTPTQNAVRRPGAPGRVPPRPAQRQAPRGQIQQGQGNRGQIPRGQAPRGQRPTVKRWPE